MTHARDARHYVEQRRGAANRRQDAVDPAHAFGHLLPVDQHLVGEHREAGRGKGEVVARRPTGTPGRSEPKHPPRAHRRDAGEPEIPAVGLHQDGGDISADAEERRLAEVELAGVAEHQVEREREQHVHRTHDQDAAPIGAGDDPGKRCDHHDRQEKANSAAAQTFSSLRSAMRPVGRSTSMARSRTKTTKSIRPEPRYCTVKASMMPTRIPARMVPCMLPKPPMITMAKALTITVGPAKGVSTSTGPRSAPAIPASADAITIVRAMSRFGLMPISPAVSRSCATARSALPRKVKRMKA